MKIALERNREGWWAWWNGVAVSGPHRTRELARAAGADWVKRNS